LLNEPKDAATTVVLNPILPKPSARFARPIRIEPFLSAPASGTLAGELANLRLPDDDQNIIVTLHCYDPMMFTHQGANGPDRNSE
jgi:endoglucanase